MASSDKKATILVVEDDRTLRDGLALNLRLKGYEVILAAEGNEGLAKAFDAKPDLILLDIMLPNCSGLEILQELRERENPVPVLVLSARGTTAQKVQGLGLGADDYMAKPFELPELLARVQALLRRSVARTAALPALNFGRAVLDFGAHRVTVSGEEIRLSAKEFDLLCLLAQAPGRTFSREAILERVWGWDFEGTPRTVDNHILSLRRALEEDPADPKHIITVRQVGYRFDL